jgi:Bifunctional DNA primase/polymerase, N-terminal
VEAVPAAHPDQIDAWWKQLPKATIGAATGVVSDLFVLDADGPEGLESITALDTHATTGSRGHGLNGPEAISP